MKALRTQFDDRRLASAVATPTCSSCCCCCCCLATSISASSLLAQRIAKEGERHQVPERHLLATLAALFVPIVAALVYFGFWTINQLLGHCTQRTVEMNGLSSHPYTYSVCTNPGAASVLPLLIITPFLVLWFLYSQVHVRKPAGRALMVTALIAAAFSVEFIGGAMLIITGVGGIAYILLVPVLIGTISVWYHGHIGKEREDELYEPPENQNVTDNHDSDTPANPPEPPQQNPPAQVSQ